MKRECVLVETDNDLLSRPDDQLPFGEWLRATPSRKPSVTTSNTRAKGEDSMMCQRLWDIPRRNVSTVEKEMSPRGGVDSTKSDIELSKKVEQISKELEKVEVSEITKANNQTSKEGEQGQQHTELYRNQERRKVAG